MNNYIKSCPSRNQLSYLPKANHFEASVYWRIGTDIGHSELHPLNRMSCHLALLIWLECYLVTYSARHAVGSEDECLVSF